MFSIDLINYCLSIYMLGVVFFDDDDKKKYLLYSIPWLLFELALCNTKLNTVLASCMGQLNGFVNYTILSGTLFVFIFFTYRESIARKVYFFYIIILTRMIIRSLANWIDITLHIWSKPIYKYALEWILILVFTIVLRIMIGKKISEDKEYEPGLFLLLIMIILSIFMYMGAYLEPVLINIDSIWYSYFTWLEIIALLAIMFVQYEGYRSFKIKTYLSLENKLNKERLKQYDYVQDVIEEINLKTHDLKHQLNDLTNDNRIDEVASKDLEKCIERYDAFINSGNTVIDAILTQKSLECKKNNIEFTCILDGSIFDRFSIIEQRALIGNLMDNAIEAILREKINNPYIKIKTTTQGNITKIMVTNPCYSHIKYDRNGIPQTVKANKVEHGYGTRSIKKIIESHGGTVSFSNKENEFSVIMLL